MGVNTHSLRGFCAMPLLASKPFIQSTLHNRVPRPRRIKQVNILRPLMLLSFDETMTVHGAHDKAGWIFARSPSDRCAIWRAPSRLDLLCLEDIATQGNNLASASV